MNKKHFILVAFFAMLFLAQPVMAQTTASSVDTTQTGVIAWVLHKFDKHMGYPAVGALMAVESSFVPFPSEFVIPPAVYISLDEKSQTDMNWWLIVIVGTIGALIGAYINYFLSLWLGRPIIYKFANSKVGHLLRLSQEKVERAEKYFNEHGVMSTLVGRLIPVIRQLISIPAGLSKMNIWSFTLFTTLGALVWNCILALLGYLAHLAGDISVIEKYNDEISIIILAIVAVAILFFVIRYFIKKRRKEQK